MRTKILILGMTFICLFNFALAQLNENKKIENKIELNIFNLEKIPNSEEIFINGISLKSSIQEILRKFKKTDTDFEHRGDDAPFILTIMPGIIIRTYDKKTIDSILLRYDGKDGFNGKTFEFFNLKTAEKLLLFLGYNFSEPDFIYHDTGIFETVKLYYLNGFIFNWMDLNHTIITSIELTNKINVEKKSKESNAKTPEEIKKEEKGEIPLSKTGFRQTLWGMAKEQVRKTELSKFIKEDKLNGEMKGLDMIIYQDNINGLDCMIVYYFAKNKLTRARYLFIESHSSKNLYISDFNKIKEQLTKKYSLPIRDEKMWLDDLYKGDIYNYGMAISIGHLRYIAEWDIEEAYIQLLLTGDNYKISHWVEYTGKAFKEFEKKVIEKAKKIIW